MTSVEPGMIIDGRFAIEARAGRGGMGAVFKAVDRVTKLPVAVKMIGALDDAMTARFARESQVLAGLRHPGIVRYVAHGQGPFGSRYLAMEWLEGQDFAERLARGPMAVPDAVTVVRMVAEAIGAAHRHGVIHRDIKPSNIFLVDGAVDHVKVLDFGIASSSRFSSTTALTRTGIAMGTPGYMSPEQARAQGGVDITADVYSIGCVLFHAIAGRAPFASENLMAALVKSVLEDTPRLSDAAENVPVEIDALVYRLMAKEPERRPPNGAEVVKIIDELGSVRLDGAGPMPHHPPTLTSAEQRLQCVVLVSDAQFGQWRDDDMNTIVGHAPAGSVAEDASRAEAIVRGFGGHAEQLAGGAVLATFQAGTAPTDQASRAARCALAMRELYARAAIVVATGRSEVVNRAAELHSFAQNNEDLGPAILLDEPTFGLLEGQFEIFCTLTGHVLIGELDALHAERKLLGRRTPCVGRAREVGMLSATFDECVSEPVARAVVLTGPPGVGKSRVRQELVRKLRERGDVFELWIARGDAMSAGSPFGLAADLVRAAAGIRGGEPDETCRTLLMRRVARNVGAGSADRVAQFLLEMIGVFVEDGVLPQVEAARCDPLLMGDQMRHAFEEFVAAECAAQPLMLVLEDLQWSDRSTVQFIDRVLKNLQDDRLMVLATARPEAEEMFGRPWAERGAQEIRIGPLTSKASRKLVSHVLDDVTSEQLDEIVGHAEGHPLLIEEILRAFKDRGTLALPDTALAMVEARVLALDDEARRVLRAASVFGRSFWAAGVGALIVGSRSDAILADWLRLLESEEWIVRRETTRFPGQIEYGFTQDVVREAVYAMLTADDRILGHRLAGEWLNTVQERDDVVLARHFELANDATRARIKYERAAELALDGNDFRSAIQHGGRAVALHADGVALGRIRTIQAEAHIHLGEFESAVEMGRAAAVRLPSGTSHWCRAVGACAQGSGKLGDVESVKTIANDLLAQDVDRRTSVPFAAAACATAVQLMIGGDMPLAITLTDRLEMLEQRIIDPDPAMVGHVTKAASARWGFTGDPGPSLTLLRKACAAFEAAGDIRSVCSLRKTQGWFAGECGALEEGETALLESVALAERLGLPNLVAHAQFDAGSPLIRLGKLAEARRHLESALGVFEAQHDHRLVAGALGCLSWVDCLEGRGADAVEKAQYALSRAPSDPVRIVALSFLAQARLAADQPAGALESSNQGLALLDVVGVAEEGVGTLCLVRARALHALGDRPAALEAITDACRRLRKRAERISDPALRKSFLMRIEENRQTLELAEAWMRRG